MRDMVTPQDAFAYVSLYYNGHFLEHIDVSVRDRFFECVGASKFSGLEESLRNGSYIKAYRYLSKILTANNDSKDVKLILKDLCSKHKSEPGQMLNDNQKALIIRHLRKELLT